MNRLRLLYFFCFFLLTLWIIYAFGGFIFIGNFIFLGKKFKTEYSIDRMGQVVDYTQFVNEYSKSYLGGKKGLKIGIDTFDLIPVYWNIEIAGWNLDPKTLQNKIVFWFFPSISRRINGYNRTIFYDALRLNSETTQKLMTVGNRIELTNDNTTDDLQIVSVSNNASYYQTLDYINKLTNNELLLVGIPDQTGNIVGSYKVIHLGIKEIN